MVVRLVEFLVCVFYLKCVVDFLVVKCIYIVDVFFCGVWFFCKRLKCDNLKNIFWLWMW